MFLKVKLLRYSVIFLQEPFDKVDNVFKKELDDDDKESDDGNLLLRLHQSLKKFPLDKLLSILHEFIITHVTHAEQGQSQWP